MLYFLRIAFLMGPFFIVFYGVSALLLWRSDLALMAGTLIAVLASMVLVVLVASLSSAPAPFPEVLMNGLLLASITAPRVLICLLPWQYSSRLRHQLEDIQQSEQRFRALAEAGSQAVWIAALRETHWSPPRASNGLSGRAVSGFRESSGHRSTREAPALQQASSRSGSSLAFSRSVERTPRPGWTRAVLRCCGRWERSRCCWHRWWHADSSPASGEAGGREPALQRSQVRSGPALRHGGPAGGSAGTAGSKGLGYGHRPGGPGPGVQALRAGSVRPSLWRVRAGASPLAAGGGGDGRHHPPRVEPRRRLGLHSAVAAGGPVGGSSTGQELEARDRTGALMAFTRRVLALSGRSAHGRRVT